MIASAYRQKLGFVLVLAGLSCLLLVSQASAASTITSFTASPGNLPWQGGTVTLAATVGGTASSCKFTATPAVATLPATVPCSATNSPSLVVTLPANTKTTAKVYTFNLVASGGAKANATPVTVTVAPEPAPSISTFDVTPAFLPAQGGTVTLSASATDATTCKFNSNPKVAPLPVSLQCTSGSASTTVTLPANTKKAAKPYTFTVTASRTGATAATLQQTVSVAGTSASSDLAISQTDSPDPVPAGNYVTYTITVQNNGPDPATGVTVVDDLPTGLSYSGAGPSQGSCDSSNPITCDLGVLASGSVAYVYVTVQPAAGGTLTNTATVSGGEADPVATNNSSTEQTTVYEPISITSGPAEGSIVRDNGAQFQFTLNGASTATCQLDNFPSSQCTSSFSTANSRYLSNSFATLGNNLGSGTHTLRISASGSFGFYQLVRHFTVPEQPLLTSNPATGPAFGQFINYNGLSALYPTGTNSYLTSEVVSEAGDGSLLLLGSYVEKLYNSSSSYTQEQGFVLMKVKPDLTLDPSFGTGGVVRVQTPGQSTSVYPELVTATGGYVYTVTYGGSSDARILRRYDLTGAKDTIFGDVTLTLPSSMQSAYDYRTTNHLEVDAEGNILVGGSMNPTNDYNDWRGMLIRITPGGVQDTSFGDGGVAPIDAIRTPGCSGSPDFNRYTVNDLVELPTGGYLVTGGDFAPCYRAMATYKLDSTGAIDTTFGVGGATQATTAFGYSGALRIDLVDANTKFMIAGGTLNSTIIARFNADGTADNTFNSGSNIKELWPYPLGFAATGVTRDAAGNYTFRGSGDYSWSPYYNENVLARTNANGDPDTAFATDGVLAISPSQLPKGDFVDSPGDPFAVFLMGVYADSDHVLALGGQVSGGTSNASEGRQALLRRFSVAGGAEG